jgi:enoyl-CoA hydratase
MLSLPSAEEPALPCSTLSLDVAGHVAELRLDRPDKLNTMTLAFWQEMVDAFAEIEVRPEVRAVVISAAGPHFTAGLDLDDFAGLMAELADPRRERGRVGDQVRRLVLEMQETFNVIERCRVPVLAAVQGACIGGGVDMVAACDARYCAADAYFRIQEINIGIVADVGTLQRLPHLMPAGMVRELAYTGARLPAERALALGLVNQVFADQAALLAGVRALAREIAAKSPLAVSGTKRMLNYARDHSVADSLDYVATWQAGMLVNGDVGEALAAAREKRAAEFPDLYPSRDVVRRRR